MKCPKCGATLELLEENTYACPSCGAKFQAKHRRKANAEAKTDESTKVNATEQEAENTQPAETAPETTQAETTPETTATETAPETAETPETTETETAETTPETAETADTTETSTEEEPATETAETETTDTTEETETTDTAEETPAESYPLAAETETPETAEEEPIATTEEIPETAEEEEQQPYTRMKNKHIRRVAKDMVHKNFGYSCLASILMYLVNFGAFILGPLGPIIVGSGAKASLAGFWYDVANDDCKGVTSIYRGFNKTAQAFAIGFLIFLLGIIPVVVFAIVIGVALGVMLKQEVESSTFIIVLVVLGIVAVITCLLYWLYLGSVKEYAFYRLNHNPDSTASQAIKYGARIAHGHIGRIWRMKIGFMWWYILVLMTLGLLLIWLLPYQNICLAKQYVEFVKDYNYKHSQQ